METRKKYRNKIRLTYSNSHPSIENLLQGRNKRVLKLNKEDFMKDGRDRSCNCNKNSLKKPELRLLHNTDLCMARGCMYQYMCDKKDCRYSYMGSTDQTMKLRTKQHRTRDTSSIYQHRNLIGHVNGKMIVKERFRQSLIGGFSCQLCCAEIQYQKFSNYDVDRGKNVAGNRKWDSVFYCMHRRKIYDRMVDWCSKIALV